MAFKDVSKYENYIGPDGLIGKREKTKHGCMKFKLMIKESQKRIWDKFWKEQNISGDK